MPKGGNTHLEKFLDAQVELMKPKSSCEKAHNMIIKPETVPTEREELTGFEYIVSKKPGKKKVEKFLQDLIDEIMEANDL